MNIVILNTSYDMQYHNTINITGLAIFMFDPEMFTRQRRLWPVQRRVLIY